MIESGQWVCFSSLPTWVERLPIESQDVFRFCLGKRFRVDEITDDGLLALDVSEWVDPVFGGRFNDIRVEPEHVTVVP